MVPALTTKRKTGLLIKVLMVIFTKKVYVHPLSINQSISQSVSQSVSFTHGGDLQTTKYTMKPTKKTYLIQYDLKQTVKGYSLKSDSHLPKKLCISLTESPLKMMKNAFYFILKKLFSFLRYLNFCQEFLVMQEKRLDQKEKDNFKIMTSQPGLQTTDNEIWPINRI